MDPTKDFFISYNHRDSAWAEWIAWQLEEDGYTTIIQAWDFRAGANFVLEMHNGLKEAAQLLAVFSPSYFDSDFTPSEWAAKFVRDPSGTSRVLIPVRVEQVPIDGLLSSIIYIDLVGKDEASARNELLSKLRRDRGKPVCAPVYPGKKGPEFPKQTVETFIAVVTGTLTAEERPIIEAFVEHLRKHSIDLSLTLRAVRKGSIILILQCSRAGLERLQFLHHEGRLDTISGHRIETIVAVSSLVSALKAGSVAAQRLPLVHSQQLGWQQQRLYLP